MARRFAQVPPMSHKLGDMPLGPTRVLWQLTRAIYLLFVGFAAGAAPFCDGAAALAVGFSFFGFFASFGPLPMIMSPVAGV